MRQNEPEKILEYVDLSEKSMGTLAEATTIARLSELRALASINQKKYKERRLLK